MMRSDKKDPAAGNSVIGLGVTHSEISLLLSFLCLVRHIFDDGFYL